jgi:hypothetical protein
VGARPGRLAARVPPKAQWRPAQFQSHECEVHYYVSIIAFLTSYSVFPFPSHANATIQVSGVKRNPTYGTSPLSVMLSRLHPSRWAV